MRGQLSADTVVGVAATAVWDVYRGLELARLVGKLLPDVIGKAEVIRGDGGVGSIIKLTYPPGSGVGYMKEIVTNIDDEMRVKETEIIEGMNKDLGFDVYRFHLEIIEKDAESSIIRSSIEYKIDDKLYSQYCFSGEHQETRNNCIGKLLSDQKEVNA